MTKIRQHYVPQFYLKNFGDQIFGFDKKEEKIIKTTARNIAVESNFYGGEIGSGPSLEKALSKLEGKFKPAIAELIQKQNFYKLTRESQKQIFLFLALQYLRTRALKQDIAGMVNSIVNEFTKSKGLGENVVQLTESGSIGMHLKAILDYPKYATLLSGMRMAVMINHTAVPFWTSDNPISLQNEFDQYPFGNLGIVSKGIELHLPITPTLALTALDPTTFYMIPEVLDVYKKQSIIRENFLQLVSSTRFLYSNTKRFLLLRDMLKKNNDLKDPTRVRFIMSTGTQSKAMKPPKGSKNKTIVSKIQTWMPLNQVDKILNLKSNEAKKS